MLFMEASRAARASAIWRRVSGECGRVDGEVEETGLDGDTEEVAPGIEGEREGASVLVDANADANADMLDNGDGGV
jgi:hypothetical protein